MASRKPPTTAAAETAAQAHLREALARVNAASARHAAIVAATSRLGVTPVSYTHLTLPTNREV